MRLELLVLLTIRLLPQIYQILFIKPLLCNLLTKLYLDAFQGKITKRNDPQISGRQISSEGDQSRKISLLNLSGSIHIV
jgi:hypothetical protein